MVGWLVVLLVTLNPAESAIVGQVNPNPDGSCTYSYVLESRFGLDPKPSAIGEAFRGVGTAFETSRTARS